MATLPTIIDFDSYIDILNAQSGTFADTSNHVSMYGENPAQYQDSIRRLIESLNGSIAVVTTTRIDANNKNYASRVNPAATNAELRARVISRLNQLLNQINILKNRLSGWIIPGQPPAPANIIPRGPPQEGGIFRKWYPNSKTQSRRGKRGSRRGKRGSRRGKRGSRR